MTKGYYQNSEEEKVSMEEESGKKKDLHDTLANFFNKWVVKITEEFKNSFFSVPNRTPIMKPQFKPECTEEKKKVLSLKVTAVLNLLNLPLYWSGIILFIWLITEIILSFVLAPEMFLKIQAGGKPIIALLGPAVVGYWTNWLAIKMLFHPRERNAVWWGLIPARRDDLIETISDEVMERLISPKIISEYLDENGIIPEVFESIMVVLKGLAENEQFRTDVRSLVSQILSSLVNSPETRGNIRAYIQKRISEWKGDSLNEKIIEWSKGIWGPKVLDEIDGLISETPTVFEDISSGLGNIIDNFSWSLREKAGGSRERVEETITKLLFDLIHNLDLKQIVRSRLRKLKEEELEKALTGNVRTELVFIQTFGGIFGLLVGLAILYPLLRLVFLGIALGLWATYRLTLFRS